MSSSSTPSPHNKKRKSLSPSPSQRKKNCGDLLGRGKTQKSIRDYASQMSSEDSKSNSSPQGRVRGNFASGKIRRKSRVKSNRSKVYKTVLSSDESDDELQSQIGYGSILGSVIASSTVCGIPKRRLFCSNETLSQTQAIVISSGDESDNFELHNSRKSCDAFSQSLRILSIHESQNGPSTSGSSKKSSVVSSSPDTQSSKVRSSPSPVVMFEEGKNCRQTSLNVSPTSSKQPHEASLGGKYALSVPKTLARDSNGSWKTQKAGTPSNELMNHSKLSKPALRLSLAKDKKISFGHTVLGQSIEAAPSRNSIMANTCLSDSEVTKTSSYGTQTFSSPGSDDVVIGTDDDSDQLSRDNTELRRSSNCKPSDLIGEHVDPRESSGLFNPSSQDLVISNLAHDEPMATSHLRSLRTLQTDSVAIVESSDGEYYSHSADLAKTNDSGHQLDREAQDKIWPLMSEDSLRAADHFASPSLAELCGDIVEASDEDSGHLSEHNSLFQISSTSKFSSTGDQSNDLMREYIEPTLIPEVISHTSQDSVSFPSRWTIQDAPLDPSSRALELSEDEVNISPFLITDGSNAGLCITHVSDSDDSHIDILPSTPEQTTHNLILAESPAIDDSNHSQQYNLSREMDASADFFSEVAKSLRDETPFESESLLLNRSIQSEGNLEPEQVQLDGSEDNSLDGVPTACTNDETVSKAVQFDEPGVSSPTAKGSMHDRQNSNLATIIPVPAQNASWKITCNPLNESLERIINLDPSGSQLAKFSKSFLLNEVIAEGKNIAALVFRQEPLSSFASQYESLSSEEISLIHSILLSSARKGCMVMYPILSSTSPDSPLHRSIDHLVSLHIFEYSSTPENPKIVGFSVEALSSIRMCFELFSVCLNLEEKLYKTYDIAHYFGKLVKTRLLLPIQTSPMNFFSSQYEVREFLDLCQVKNCLLESSALSIQDLAWKICASLLMLQSSVSDSPCSGYLYANYVHALDAALKVGMDASLEHAYLGILLNQNIAGHSLKAEWCRQKLKCLSKIQPLNTVEELLGILSEKGDSVEFIVKSEFVLKLLENKRLRFSDEDKSTVNRFLKPKEHKVVQINASNSANELASIYPVVGRKLNGRLLNMRRAGIFHQYSSEFPNGLQDSGTLLINTIYLVFWESVYHPVDGVFVSKFQKCPMDWGSAGFYDKRRSFIEKRIQAMKESGYEAIIALMDRLKSKFSHYDCVVDWSIVSKYFPQICRILFVLGLDKFFSLASHLLHLNERVHGFPDLILWNDVSVKLIGMKRPADPLYPHQVVWLENLTKMGIEAEECQVLGC